jgi:putative membrane protein
MSHLARSRNALALRSRKDGGMTVGPQDANGDPHDQEPDVRFSYANERTFLAWIRTALGLVTAGLAITQLLPPFDIAGARRVIGLPLIALGVVIAIASLGNWRANERAMRSGLPLPRSVLPAIAASVVSVVALVGLVLALFAGTKK